MSPVTVIHFEGALWGSVIFGHQVLPSCLPLDLLGPLALLRPAWGPRHLASNPHLLENAVAATAVVAACYLGAAVAFWGHPRLHYFHPRHRTHGCRVEVGCWDAPAGDQVGSLTHFYCYSVLNLSHVKFIFYLDPRSAKDSEKCAHVSFKSLSRVHR